MYLFVQGHLGNFLFLKICIIRVTNSNVHDRLVPKNVYYFFNKINQLCTQVFRSGNLLLHHPSNSHYCVSLRQLAVALTINGQGNHQLGRNQRRLVDIFIIKYIQVQYCSFQISIAAPQVRQYFVQANKAKRAGTNKWSG